MDDTYEIQLGGAITVVNGIGMGIGSAIGTELTHTLRIEPSESIIFETTPKTDTRLLEACLDIFGNHFQQEIDNVKISTELAYPGAKGMKTSSVVATGTIALLSKFFEKSLSDHEIINLGADAAIEAGVSITGAIDDAYSTYHGDFWVTHNLDRNILSHHKMDLNKSVILIHPEKSMEKTDVSIDLEFLDRYVLKQAIEDAIDGNWKSAIERNSRVYAQFLLEDWNTVNEMEDLIDGTVGLNGTGPSLFVICDPSSKDPNLDLLQSNYSEYTYSVTSLR